MNKYYAAKQENDYSCGVAALRYLMIQCFHGEEINDSIWPTEEKLKTTPENGTAHENIENWLLSVGVPFKVYQGEYPKPPFLINYQWDRDGHYGVVVNVGDKILIWNPWKDAIDKYHKNEFEKRWYSKRYGPKWALSINRIDSCKSSDLSV